MEDCGFGWSNKLYLRDKLVSLIFLPVGVGLFYPSFQYFFVLIYKVHLKNVILFTMY